MDCAMSPWATVIYVVGVIVIILSLAIYGMLHVL